MIAGEPMALVPAGFTYKGLFYGRALGTEGWKSVTLPAPYLQKLLKAA